LPRGYLASRPGFLWFVTHTAHWHIGQRVCGGGILNKGRRPDATTPTSHPRIEGGVQTPPHLACLVPSVLNQRIKDHRRYRTKEGGCPRTLGGSDPPLSLDLRVTRGGGRIWARLLSRAPPTSTSPPAHQFKCPPEPLRPAMSGI